MYEHFEGICFVEGCRSNAEGWNDSTRHWKLARRPRRWL
jgi:hypothetical protein